jgi:replicative DNA helicase
MSAFARVPPADLESEAAVLSAVLLDPVVLDGVRDILTPACFYADANGRVFEAALAIADAGEPVDAVSVLARLRAKGRLEQIGGAPYLAQLADATPAVANVEAHARIVRGKWRRRQMISTCQHYAAEGYGAIEDDDAWVQSVEQAVFDAAQMASEREGAEDFAALIPAVLREVRERQAAGGADPGVDTGWADLTRQMGGWESGCLYVVGGRAGMGKTSLLLGAAMNVARRGQLAGLLSAEMRNPELALRALAVESGVNLADIRTGRMDEATLLRVEVAAERMRQWPLFFVHRPGATLPEIQSVLRREIARRGTKPAVFAVDYLQILGTDPKADTREQGVAGLGRGLKLMAQRMGIPVLAGSQLNREVESRSAKSKRPQLSDLRESGAIEQDADVVILLYRDEYYHRDSHERGIVEAIVAKQRQGATGTVKLQYTAETTAIHNLASTWDHGQDDYWMNQ